MKRTLLFFHSCCFSTVILFFSTALIAQQNSTFLFADTNRIEKIKATQAFVAKMYQDHAAKNNFPGFVYGIVADGKLVYSGSIGYTNVVKKIPASSTSALGFKKPAVPKSEKRSF